MRDYVRKYSIGTNPRNPSFLPDVCRVSKHTLRETMEVFLEGTIFQVCSIEQNQVVHTFLSHAFNGFASVRGLHFAFFDCFPQGFGLNADLELAVRCSGLQELRLSFHNRKLFQWVRDNGDYVGAPRPAQEMWDYYELRRVLDAGVRFQKLTILRKGWGNEFADLAALDLAAFVARKFLEEKNRGVGTEVVGNK